MIALQLGQDRGVPLKLLCLGSHSDDIEIGCGGSVLRLLSGNQQLDVTWVVFSSSKEREQETRNSSERFLNQAHRKELIIKDFRDGFFPFDGANIKDVFESLKRVFPDLIFTHNRKDAHQDHRLLAELTWNTFRNHLILEYEIPKYDGDLGRPGVFVPLSAAGCQKKIGYIMDAFKSQHSK